jgi:hypothetical protein
LIFGGQSIYLTAPVSLAKTDDLNQAPLGESLAGGIHRFYVGARYTGQGPVGPLDTLGPVAFGPPVAEGVQQTSVQVGIPRGETLLPV